ncbi:MAG TPA: AraC family transcriptional regulator [Firmicutes bacterium]|nr:AraC family transcriptional regulator [Bacillota bacterium]
MQMDQDILTHGLQAMLHSVTEVQNTCLLWPGLDSPSRLDHVPAPTVYKREAHPYCQIAYAKTGNCIMVLDDSAYPMREGDICIVPPGRDHYEAPATSRHAYTLIWFRLYPTQIVAHETVYSADEHQLFKTGRNAAWLKIEGNIKILLDSLYDEIATRKPLASLVTRSCFVALLALLVRDSVKYEHNYTDLERHPNAVVRAMAAYVKQYYADPRLAVGHIAAELAFNPKYFIEYIHKQTGITPYNYVLQFRLNKAKEFLSDTDWTIARISEEVGFTSPYYFSVAFKRSTGMSPKDYRLAMQAERR